MPPGRNNKILQYMNYRMRVTTRDGRALVGTFMAYDKFMNMVLGDCEEFRKIKGSKTDEEQKRSLGLVLLRGENVVSLAIEGPPPSEDKRTVKLSAGAGVGRAAGRGIASTIQGAPVGLSGPARGVGAPAPGNMAPQGGPRPGPPGGPPGGPRAGPPGGPPGMPPGMPGMRPPFRPGMPPGMPPGGYRMPPPGMRPGFRPGMPPGYRPPPQ
eukprot:m.354615 g.354615  ORF g.354615 m.354615 type:complete len:211 (+) comp17067_c0_seq1:66-698(+)